jgi:uncharacterized FlaG/YvyC family protein
MSFIFQDSDLIDRLLHSALSHQLKFTKQGQAVEQNRNAMLGHLRALQDQFFNAAGPPDPNAGPTISHKGNASLGSPQLESLGDLVQWLANNETRINDQVIAYPTKPADDQNYVPYRLETHLTSPQQRGQEPGLLYVDPNLLQQYLVTLQASEAEKPNDIFKKQLDFIIEDANKSLGLHIDPDYKAPEKVLPDNAVLDHLPHTFNVKVPLQGGDVPFTYGDSKDITTLNAWLSRNNIGLDLGDRNPVGVNNPRFDVKQIVNSIVQRAQFLASRATPLTKDLADYYVRQTGRLQQQVPVATNAPGAPGITSPDNPAGQAGQTAPGSQNQSQTGQTSSNQTNQSFNQGNQGNQENQENGQSTGNLQNLIDDITDTLPLSLQNIDFARIKEFFGKVAQVMSNNSTVMSYIQQVDRLIKQATDLTENGDTFFQLGISPTSLVNMLKDPRQPGKFKASYFPTLVSLLRQIVDGTRAVLGYFMSAHMNHLNSSQRAYLFGQIGKRPDDSSIYSRNVEYLNQWMMTPTT